MKVEIYSDVVCPWCYIGEKRFARALAAFPGAGDVEVVFRPYQLDPTTPHTAAPTLEYLAKRFGPSAGAMAQRVTEAAAGEGITMDFARALSVNTRTAHRLAGLAEREYGAEVQRALVEKLFDAHFTRGVNVGDPEELVTLAAAVGIDADRARAYLASNEGEELLDAELAAARGIGVRAVPTFVLDGQYVVEGGQPASVFLQVLEEVERRRRADTATDAGSSGDAGDAGDACADGSCVVGG